MNALTRLIVLAAVLTLGAAPSAAAVTIEYWTILNLENDRRAFLDAVDAFESEYPEIDVDVVFVDAGGLSWDAIQVAAAGGRLPDVMYLGGWLIPTFASGGVLLPLDDISGLIDTASLESQFIPSAWGEATQFNDRLYGIPFTTDIRGLFWNADLYENAGLNGEQGPATFAELNEHARKLTVLAPDGDTYEQVGFVPWGGNWYFPAWAWSFGGELYDAGTRKVTLDTPENLEALNYLANSALELGYDRIQQLYASGRNFLTGHEGLTINGLRYSNLADSADIDFRTGRVPHPPQGRNGTWGGQQIHAVAADTQHPQEAITFALWIGTNGPAQAEYAKRTGGIPSNFDALRIMAGQAGPLELPFIEQMPEANPRTTLWNYMFFDTIPMVDEVLAGRKPPQAALQEVERQMQPKYDEFFAQIGN